MALNNYAGLLATVASWLNRNDLTSVIPDFVTLAEAALDTRLRTAEMEASETLSPDSDGLYDLPDDLIDIKSVRALTGTPSMLQQVGSDYAETAYPTRGAGYPAGYVVEGNALRVVPATESDVELWYFAKLRPLATASTNWLLKRSPQIYPMQR
jgi:hypothetical protein